MAQLVLKYDARNAFAASMIEALKKSGVFTFSNLEAKKHTKPAAKAKKCGLDGALDDIKAGRITEVKDTKAYFDK
jgi:hypothetical protein